MIVEKLPPLKCPHCGNTHVTMENGNIECNECSSNDLPSKDEFVDISDEAEYRLFQIEYEK